MLLGLRKDDDSYTWVNTDRICYLYERPKAAGSTIVFANTLQIEVKTTPDEIMELLNDHHVDSPAEEGEEQDEGEDDEEELDDEDR